MYGGLQRVSLGGDTGNAGGRWRVASYMRLSKEDGCGVVSDSIEGQRHIIEQWARARDDVEIVAEYADDGYSGATFDRPGFSRMMDDAGTGLFNTIAVKDISRFGRSYLDCGNWIERDLPRIGIRLYSVTDGFDSMARWDYNMALLFPMKNLMNEMHVIATSEKVRASLAAKRQRGEFVGNFAPYGYSRDPHDRHRMVVVEAQARVVSRIFAMRLAGESASGIARTLNGEGIPSPSEAKRLAGSSYRTCFAKEGRTPKWHAKTVLKILRDETYTGTLMQGRSAKPNWRHGQGIPLPREEWYITPCAHEPIVDAATFKEVGRMLGLSQSLRSDVI